MAKRQRRTRDREHPAGGDSAAPVQSWADRHPLLVLGALCLPLLLALRRGEFLWTDIAEVQDGALISTSIGDFLDRIVKGSEDQYYRPSVLALHSLDFLLFGDSPLAFRGTNLLLHLVNIFLVYVLARNLGLRPLMCSLVGGLFAVHPLTVTPLMWVSDRTDLMALLGSLACLALVQRYCRNSSWLVLLASGIALLGGLGGKETAAATLALTVAVAWFADRKTRRSLIVAALVQAMVIGCWLFWHSRVTSVPLQETEGLDMAGKLSLYSLIHFEYALEILFPPSLTACDGRVVPNAPGAWIAAGIAALMAVVALVLWCWRSGHRRVLLGIAWSVAFLLPTSGIFVLRHARADRYLYCALPGLVLVGVLAGDAWLSHLLPRLASRLKCWLFVGVYSYFTICLALRIPDFSSNAVFWDHETRQSDACIEGHAYLGREALLSGKPDLALRELNIALAPPRRGLVAYSPTEISRYYLGLALTEVGDLTTAVEALQKVVETTALSWLRAEAAYSLALVDLRRNDFAGVVRHLGQALSYSPRPSSRGDIFLLRSYANLLLQRRSESMQDFRAYLREQVSPTSPERKRMAMELRAALWPSP
jgi:protein O-mannosyl-transferase